MLRTRAVEVSLWEAVLPPEVLRLPEELARVDALLDDPAFFAPFVPFFDPRVGRPSTPMEVYLRLMFLKFRYRLGYESLCREVSDSITRERALRSARPGRRAWLRWPRLTVTVSRPSTPCTARSTRRTQDAQSCHDREFVALHRWTCQGSHLPGKVAPRRRTQ